jgi:hypothetical protein
MWCRRGETLIRLEVVGFLRVREAGEGVRGAATVNLDFLGALVFRPGLAQDGVSGQGFVVNLSNQIRFAGVVFLPHLADLYLTGGHNMNVDRIGRPVNTAARECFAGATGETLGSRV